jgi:aminoglycoside phosphotransferase family enzyme/gluconate kinase
MADDAQAEIIEFLRDPAAHGVDRVDVVETHISVVFLAGDRAYKLKRAVKYPYLDFSTVAKRRAMCRAELELNRRTAPALYREVRAVVRGADGRVGWGPDGTVLDWVVVMSRFDESRRFDRLALDAGLISALAERIASFHAEAAPRRDFGGGAAMAEVARTNIDHLRDSRKAGFDAAAIDALERAAAAEAARLGPLFDRRRDAGKVRRCHGDLHLGNIFLSDDGPVLFDCIEFSERIATIDVLYDLGFVAMDLLHHRRPDLASLVCNRYLDLAGEEDGFAVLPFCIAVRAAIRGHVAGSALDRGWGGDAADARRYLAEAAAALAPAPPLLVAVGGLSGSGKSTLAARLAPLLGRVPGARLLRSDVLRKRRFGVAPETRLPPAAYTAEVSAAVYRELGERAAALLAGGAAVVIDAVALRADERAAFAAVAAAAGVRFCGLWLDAPGAVMAARITARRADASDATPEVLARQAVLDPGPIDWLRLDAGGGADATEAAARHVLQGVPGVRT